ncbi:hypothetical protein HPB50_001459 [Hyalomma asiaticum]|uniref:Uncharacterized protein n=1 Tax=Hyalomma asiaticum TaxID=266040 RepID=A0ACB7RHQ3_HYAAI|nr:hypothetical protein HPB50_001459 [Hyalomma asiaticum]
MVISGTTPTTSEPSDEVQTGEEHPTGTTKARVRHMRRCSYCGKVFWQKCDWVKHVRVHTGERPYACRFCPMAFSRNETLTRHLQMHFGDSLFRCRFCPKAFTRDYNLRRHEVQHVQLFI